MSPITAAALEALFASSADVIVKEFLTVYDPDYADGAQPVGWPLRFVSHIAPITGPGGFIFSPALFEAVVPDETTESAPELKITALGPAEDIIAVLRSVPYAPRLKAELCTYDGTTVGPVEMAYNDLRLRDASVEGMSISFSFGSDDLASLNFPHYRFSPLNTPGIY